MENNESYQPELFSLAPDGSGKIEKIGGEKYEEEKTPPTEKEELDKFISEHQKKYPCKVNPVRLPYILNASGGKEIETEEEMKIVAKNALSEWVKGKPAYDKLGLEELEKKFFEDQKKLKEYREKMKEVWEEYKQNPEPETIDTITPAPEENKKEDDSDEKPPFTGWRNQWENEKEDREETNSGEEKSE